MKIYFPTLIFACIFFAACNQKKDEHHHGSHDSENSATQALYDQVMEIHDEVMPKMNDLYKAKTSLQTRLAMPGLPESERTETNNKIARIDSASEGMMAWMRQFDPLPDSLGEDSARDYLEKELVKVKKVREDILETLKNVQ